jgi:hypothetical protein
VCSIGMPQPSWSQIVLPSVAKTNEFKDCPQEA